MKVLVLLKVETSQSVTMIYGLQSCAAMSNPQGLNLKIWEVD